MDNSSKSKSFTRTEAALLFLLGGLILWLAIEAWFDLLQFRVFAGDDMDTFSRNQTLTAPPIESVARMYHKFRPVAAAIIFAVAKWTKCDFREVASISVAIHAANAMLFFSLLYRAIKLPLALSAGITVIAIFNRFTTYLLMQDQAIMEGVGVAVLILLLHASLSFLDEPKMRGALLLSILFATLVYIHERYLVLAVPLALLGAGSFKINRKASCTVVAGAFVAGLSYLGIKKLYYGAPIMVGAGTSTIDLGSSQILTFVWQGALNLIGINRGPAYLSLEDFRDSTSWIQCVSVGAALFSCGLLVGTVWTIARSPAGKEKNSRFIQLGFYLLTTAVLLLAASVTFRQEFRWVYPAFLVFLCALGYGLRIAGTARRWFYPALIALVLLSLCREMYLVRRLSRFYSFESYQIANNLVATLRNVGGVENQDSILIRGDVPSKEWIFMDGVFSRFYHLPSLEFLPAKAPIEQTDSSRLVLDYDGVDRTFKVTNDQITPTDPSHRMEYSLLERLPEASTPNDRWSTPTKTPIFVTAKNGVRCVAVVAPVDLRISAPKAANVLYVCLSHMYAMGDGADVEIAAITPGGTTQLLSRNVPPLANDDAVVWRKYEFTLPADTQQVELHVFSKTDPTADWIAVRDFSVN
ncbi:MAG: hypothetical protein QOH88_841 [Verrucomicrobiota bacterium]|jgi:hypothetical protein